MDPLHQAKLAKLGIFFPRNYRGDDPNVRIAIVAIPVINVQLIRRVIATNVGNVWVNLESAFPSTNLTVV